MGFLFLSWYNDTDEKTRINNEQVSAARRNPECLERAESIEDATACATSCM